MCADVPTFRRWYGLAGGRLDGLSRGQHAGLWIRANELTVFLELPSRFQQSRGDYEMDGAAGADVRCAVVLQFLQ